MPTPQEVQAWLGQRGVAPTAQNANIAARIMGADAIASRGGASTGALDAAEEINRLYDQLNTRSMGGGGTARPAPPTGGRGGPRSGGVLPDNAPPTPATTPAAPSAATPDAPAPVGAAPAPTGPDAARLAAVQALMPVLTGNYGRPPPSAQAGTPPPTGVPSQANVDRNIARTERPAATASEGNIGDVRDVARNPPLMLGGGVQSPAPNDSPIDIAGSTPNRPTATAAVPPADVPWTQNEQLIAAMLGGGALVGAGAGARAYSRSPVTIPSIGANPAPPPPISGASAARPPPIPGGSSPGSTTTLVAPPVPPPAAASPAAPPAPAAASRPNAYGIQGSVSAPPPPVIVTPITPTAGEVVTGRSRTPVPQQSVMSPGGAPGSVTMSPVQSEMTQQSLSNIPTRTRGGMQPSARGVLNRGGGVTAVVPPTVPTAPLTPPPLSGRSGGSARGGGGGGGGRTRQTGRGMSEPQWGNPWAQFPLN